MNLAIFYMADDACVCVCVNSFEWIQRHGGEAIGLRNGKNKLWCGVGRCREIERESCTIYKRVFWGVISFHKQTAG